MQTACLSAAAGQAADERPALKALRDTRLPAPQPGEHRPRDDQFYDVLRWQLPDPIEARDVVSRLLQQDLDASERKYYEDAMGYIAAIDRPRKVPLTLDDAIQRALANSYNIRVQSYNPAIAATSVVEAEAVFDTVFFSDATWIERNTPTATALQATDSSQRFFNTGVRKLLPTGAAVEAAWSASRDKFDNFAFQVLNPSYTNALTFQVRQPFLRGFGIDFNRSQINVAQKERRISEYAFARSLQDHLLNVEEAYWQVAAARRNLVIESRLIAEFQRIYDFLLARSDFDASKVEISQSKARLDIQVANFARVKQNVFDAEDNLKNLLNDPQLNLIDDYEIVPGDFPTGEAIGMDRLGELQSALDHRQELKEAELRIEQANISVGVAKNQALPRFDVVFSYGFDALGSSFNDAWNNLWDFDFHNYTVGLQFEWPVGNRGPRAALRRARLEYAQALAALKQTIEAILLDVDISIRELFTNFELIDANLTSVQSQMDEVEAIEDRAERRDPDQLQRELNARQRLAITRQELLRALVNYNLAIVRLERAKGTLLDYSNVAVVDSHAESETGLQLDYPALSPEETREESPADASGEVN